MLPHVVNLTALTRHRVEGPLTAWQTPNGRFNVEHLAGRSPAGECLVFYWSPQRDWQVVNVTAKTGARIAGALTSWQTKNGPYTVEHLAGRAPNGDLLVFWWSPQHDWQVVNVSEKTGHKIADTVTSWLTPNGPHTVEHLAGRAPNGDLLVFWWSPIRDWQVVNVTAKTGRQIASAVASYVTPDGPMLVEHLAAHDCTGALLVFWWSPAHDWQVVDVTGITGRRVAGEPCCWLAGNRAHLGANGPDGSLLVFWWSPSANWRVVNASSISGEPSDGALSPYQLPSGAETAELLAGRKPDGSLLLHWWKPSRDWQAVNLSDAIGGIRFAADPVAWVTPSANRRVEHWAAPTKDGTLLVVWSDSEPRDVTDTVGGPFKELKRIRNLRRKIVVILWDPHRPGDPAPLKQDVEATLFGVQNSVRGYFLENSNGHFTIENAGVVGWYDADRPPTHYWGPVDTNDSDGDGWVNPHVEKWAEAIRKAGVDFDFSAFDGDPLDGVLKPEELGVLIVIPQNSPFGTNRGVVGREYPNPQPLVVRGVSFGVIAEAYIGSPPNLGLVAHELDHLLLHGPDMYFTLPTPYAAGAYSLMDGTYQGSHLDPFAKLKHGWLRPKVILKSGTYSLKDVETGHTAWILVNPQRGLDEYFIVENRWPGTSYDRVLPDRGGLAVWHIMENPAVYGTLPPPPGTPADKWALIAADDWGRRAIRMIRPKPLPPIDDTRALWDGTDPETGYDLLSDDPDPNHSTLRWADGSPSGFAIRAISARGAEMTATVEVPF